MPTNSSSLCDGLIFMKMTKKKARFGALPKLNMPKKSHQSTKPAPRTTRTSVVQETDLPYVNHGYYKSFLNLCQ